MIPTTKAVSIMIACLGTSSRARKNSFMIPAKKPASMASIMMIVNRMIFSPAFNSVWLHRAPCSTTQPHQSPSHDEGAARHSITSSAPHSLWQATKHEHNACPVGSALANAPEVFSVEPDDFPTAKHVCESSVDREAKCPISSRQHYCKGLERKVVRKQRKVPQTLSLR